MTCNSCDTAAQREHWDFADGCDGCKARGLGRIFLAKGERGRRFRMACEQAGLTIEQVQRAHSADARHKEAT